MEYLKFVMLSKMFQPVTKDRHFGRHTGIVRLQGQFINRVKVPAGVCHNAVAESNSTYAKCVFYQVWAFHYERSSCYGLSIVSAQPHHLKISQALRYP